MCSARFSCETGFLSNGDGSFGTTSGAIAGTTAGGGTCVSAGMAGVWASIGGACIGQAQSHFDDELHCEKGIKRIDLVARL